MKNTEDKDLMAYCNMGDPNNHFPRNHLVWSLSSKVKQIYNDLMNFYAKYSTNGVYSTKQFCVASGLLNYQYSKNYD